MLQFAVLFVLYLAAVILSGFMMGITGKHADLEARDGALAQWMGRYVGFTPTHWLEFAFNLLARANVYVPTLVAAFATAGIGLAFVFGDEHLFAPFVLVGVAGWLTAGAAILSDRYFTHLRPSRKRPDLGLVPATQETENSQLVVGAAGLVAGLLLAGIGVSLGIIENANAAKVAAASIVNGVMLFAPLVPILRILRARRILKPVYAEPITAADLPNVN